MQQILPAVRIGRRRPSDPLGERDALEVASFRAGWRDELEAIDLYFILSAVDRAAYTRGQAAARLFRAAVQVQGKRRADWSAA